MDLLQYIVDKGFNGHFGAAYAASENNNAELVEKLVSVHGDYLPAVFGAASGGNIGQFEKYRSLTSSHKNYQALAEVALGAGNKEMFLHIKNIRKTVHPGDLWCHSFLEKAANVCERRRY